MEPVFELIEHEGDPALKVSLKLTAVEEATLWNNQHLLRRVILSFKEEQWDELDERYKKVDIVRTLGNYRRIENGSFERRFQKLYYCNLGEVAEWVRGARGGGGRDG